jgi:RNA polymerase sigma factor (TIGR02999 family)
VTEQGDVTAVLLRVGAGEDGAIDRLFELVYQDLRRIARGQLRRLRPGQTLDTTGLVHETYLKMIDQSRVRLHDRSHFYAVAARAMRQILVDAARRVARVKHGAGAPHVELDEGRLRTIGDAEQVLQVDEALAKLAAHSERLAKVVEYRFFGGLTFEEIAELLSLTSRTVRNDWARARAWLETAMTASPPVDS